MEDKRNNQIHIGHGDFTSVKTSLTVKMDEHFTLITERGPIDLKVELTADFATIPSEYHEVFMNVLTSKYLNKVTFTNNPFSQCQAPIKKRWWQIWKKFE